MKLRPLINRLIIERIKPETKTKSGIVIPNPKESDIQEAIVMAVGPGKPDRNGKPIKMKVKVDDKILFVKYSGDPITYEEKDYFIMREEDVLAIL